MSFKLKMTTDSAAFADGDGRAEVARLLRIAAGQVELDYGTHPIFDINGNKVGAWSCDLPAEFLDSRAA